MTYGRPTPLPNSTLSNTGVSSAIHHPGNFQTLLAFEILVQPTIRIHRLFLSLAAFSLFSHIVHIVCRSAGSRRSLVAVRDDGSFGVKHKANQNRRLAGGVTGYILLKWPYCLFF
jgi:hypothetical protein